MAENAAIGIVRTPRLAAVLVQPQPGHDYGHDCQLSKSRGITVCTDPGHGRDAELLREALIIIGVLPDPYPSVERDANGKTKPPRGRCGVCGLSNYVNRDGRLYKHPARDGAGDCGGSYSVPERAGVAA